MGGRDLRSVLLAPQSLALIGASDDPDKTSGRPQACLRRAGWKGRVYPVNARRAEVQGARAWPSVSALPEVPDHALILTPTEAVRAAVETCARLGVGAVSVLATGFADSGFRRDGDVGPIIMLAAGGVLAERVGDRALRLAPIDVDGAREMIAEVKSLRALEGYRERPAGDMATLAEALAGLSQLAYDPAVVEAEINPLVVRRAGEGVVAVDALMRVLMRVVETRT